MGDNKKELVKCRLKEQVWITCTQHSHKRRRITSRRSVGFARGSLLVSLTMLTLIAWNIISSALFTSAFRLLAVCKLVSWACPRFHSPSASFAFLPFTSCRFIIKKRDSITLQVRGNLSSRTLNSIPLRVVLGTVPLPSMTPRMVLKLLTNSEVTAISSSNLQKRAKYLRPST